MVVDNPFKHMADIPLFHSEQVLSSHIGGHLTHEEEMTHDEPYGYVVGDNPFSATAKLEMILMAIVIGGVTFFWFNFAHFNFRKYSKSEHWMHQRLTAGMLEDEIREFRRQGSLE